MHDNSLPDNLLEEGKASPRGLRKAGLIAGGAALLVVALGLFSRHRDELQAQQWSDAQSVPTVHLTMPMSAGRNDTLALPGTMQAWNSAKIFARVPGYVHAWYRDIGASVGARTPLGSIDTPELDQQIIQARATLARTRAEAALARTTAARWNDLLSTNSVSRQEADEKNGTLATRNAEVVEEQANLGRLLAMKSYATVRAPFAGVVTSRNADIGDLVGPGATAQTPMFAVSDEHHIRVYVNVPQQYSAAMHPGLAATLSVPDYPGRSFQAKLLDQSGAISSQTGAQQVELVTDNPGMLLKAGGYAQVRFDLPVNADLVTVPASALVLRGGGTKLATVTPEGRIHLISVVVGHDLGGSVQISAGLDRNTKIVDNPPDSITEGEQVRIEGAGSAGHAHG